MGPQLAQLVGPPLSSDQIELSGGSASAGGGGMTTKTTSAKNDNAITTDKISPGGWCKANEMQNDIAKFKTTFFRAF